MRTTKIFALCFFVMLTGITYAQADRQSQLIVPLSQPGKQYSLTVNLRLAYIKVSPYQGKEVIIDFEPAGKKNERTTARPGMHVISSLNNIDVIASENNNAIKVTNKSPMKEMATVNIKIPAGAANLKISVADGMITGSDLSGDIEVSNLRGGISLQRISGSVVASSNNGSIVVTFKSVNPDAALAISSHHGDIDVTLPANFKANTRLRTDLGSIFTDFDLITEKSQNDIIRTPSEKLYQLRSDNWVYGKIGGGGQELIIQSYRGSIYLRKAN